LPERELEFGVAAAPPLGGQLLSLRGLGGEYDELFLPLHGAHQAHNAAWRRCAAVEAFSVRELTARSTIDTSASDSPAMDSPAGSRRFAARRPIVLDGAHNAAGAQSTAQRA